MPEKHLNSCESVKLNADSNTSEEDMNDKSMNNDRSLTSTEIFDISSLLSLDDIRESDSKISSSESNEYGCPLGRHSAAERDMALVDLRMDSKDSISPPSSLVMKLNEHMKSMTSEDKHDDESQNDLKQDNIEEEDLILDFKEDYIFGGHIILERNLEVYSVLERATRVISKTKTLSVTLNRASLTDTLSHVYGDLMEGDVFSILARITSTVDGEGKFDALIRFRKTCLPVNAFKLYQYPRDRYAEAKTRHKHELECPGLTAESYYDAAESDTYQGSTVSNSSSPVPYRFSPVDYQTMMEISERLDSK